MGTQCLEQSSPENQDRTAGHTNWLNARSVGAEPQPKTGYTGRPVYAAPLLSGTEADSGKAERVMRPLRRQCPGSVRPRVGLSPEH